MLWKSQDGSVRAITELTSAHLDNAIKYCIKWGKYDGLVELMKEKKRREKASVKTNDKSLISICPFCEGTMTIEYYECYEIEVGFGFNEKWKQLTCACGARGPKIEI